MMTFSKVARLLEKPDRAALARVADRFLPDVRWLVLQLRTCRNRFVEHADRPWQRGTGADMVGMSFRLELLSPPGWIDDAAIDGEIAALLRLAPEGIRNAPPTSWERARPRALLERIV